MKYDLPWKQVFLKKNRIFLIKERSNSSQKREQTEMKCVALHYMEIE